MISWSNYSGRFLDKMPRVRLRIIGCCNSDPTVHIFEKRFSDQMGNFNNKDAYEYVGECLKLRVILLAMSF